jgi:two-component system, cell cycle sensor histidine kinase and response regulator CckA
MVSGDGKGQASGGEGAQLRKGWNAMASILRQVPDFLTHISTDGRFLFLNRIIPGLDEAAVMSRTIYDFTDAAYHDVIRAKIARAVETRSQQEYETLGVGPNQQPAHYFTRVAPVIEDDVVSTVILISTDVTRLKLAESARAESEAALKHVLTVTKMGTWWWDPELGRGGLDAVAAEIFALPPGEAAMEQVMERIHPEDVARVRAALEAAVETGVYPTIEHRVLRPDGSLRWISARAEVRSSPSKRFVGGAIDVTARKVLELELAQARKLESIGRLAGGIAHDFNNMLTVILGYVEYAASSVSPESEVASDLREIRKAADRSVALTSQLLAFARQQVIQPTVVDLNAVVRDIDKLLRRLLGEDVEIVSQLAATGLVKVDRNQFEQVLLNLATNARDSMPRGGHLTIRSADVDLDHESAATHPGLMPGPHVMIAVSDSGCGIAAKDLPQIFEPFFTTKELGKGTGLGLAMVYGVIRQNHGAITVRSELAHGTTLEILLPVAVGEPERRRTRPEAERGGAETLLLVEDEVAVRTIALTALRRAGYQVISASDGVEALAVASAHDGPIDLLVTDVVMPKMGGEQLARELALLRPGIPVLFVSGYADSFVVEDRVAGNGSAFLQKPFTLSTLVERVRAAIDQRR